MIKQRLLNLLTAAIGPVRVAKLRNHTSSLWRYGFRVAGLYRPIPAVEADYAVEKYVTFNGDVPIQIQGGERKQGRMAFTQPRPLVENIVDLVVTPNGGAWHKGIYKERFSVGRPGLRLLLESRRPENTVPEAFVIQCAHNDTYGDWVSEFLVPILRHGSVSAPLLLPMTIAEKPYVARDLAAMGIDWHAIEKPINIKKAHVLRQQKYFVHFPEEDVQVLRRFFGEPIAAARPGGIVYMSRFGEDSEVAARQYPSLIIERIVNLRGGRIIRTNDSTLDEYADAAIDAETVIFDHGSAIYNALGWPVRRVVEIASDTWWNNAFLMLADAAGIHDYTIIRGGLGEEHVKERLSQVLDAPLDAGLST